ncbi:hypothetical protein SAMN05421676_10238 [Salinibacillus kushneri]|uniref:Uncharacterized protein n=1 Tax=Salinibacillus kushneri TaxID=237682 RepID=A0A1I0A4Y9_9BACI|nr:hypothetical protein [Salinibacillus kushneri]SES89194.1 hypothetical protein SAMN05421676_10238 [Salinibacillus kushneri]
MVLHHNPNYRGKIYLDFIPNENKTVEFLINFQRTMDICVEFQYQWIVKQLVKDIPSTFTTDKDYEQGIDVLKKYVVFSEGGR